MLNQYKTTAICPYKTILMPSPKENRHYRVRHIFCNLGHEKGFDTVRTLALDCYAISQ